jgi:hypothetical protein
LANVYLEQCETPQAIKRFMNGDIFVSSIVGQSSIFRFYIYVQLLESDSVEVVNNADNAIANQLEAKSESTEIVEINDDKQKLLSEKLR